MADATQNDHLAGVVLAWIDAPNEATFVRVTVTCPLECLPADTAPVAFSLDVY